MRREPVMERHEPLSVRPLNAGDLDAARRILNTSDYIHYRFSPDELARLLGRLPGAGVFSAPEGRLARVTQGGLRAFLLVNWLVGPSAWIGAFGVTWSEGERFAEYLNLLLPEVARQTRDRGARMLYYSGGNFENDWLRNQLAARGFDLVSVLRSYDKEDYTVPSVGNQRVSVRPFEPRDAEALVAVEDLSFGELWRHDAAMFREVGETYPYFVVAEDEAGICGYQYNAVDSMTGYLVRIAAHPRVEGQGVGTRLMAEAVSYFARRSVWRIALNTEETNTRAHRLYEWFGFHRVEPHGFVLAHDLTGLIEGRRG